jgi:hypothetical protein
MLTMDGRPVWFTTPTVPLLRPGIGKQPSLKRGIGHLLCEHSSAAPMCHS